MKQAGMFFSRYPIVIMAVFAILIRLLYFSYDAHPIVTNDSYGYYNLAAELRKNPLPVIFSDSRVPVYPIVIAGIVQPEQPLDQSAYVKTFPRDSYLLFVQAILGLGTVILTALILMLLQLPMPLVYIGSILVLTNPALLYWEHAVLPESLVTFLLTLFVYSSILSFKKTTIARTGMFVAIGIFLFLSKPVFLLLPFCIFIFLAIHDRTKRQLLHSMVACIVYACFLVGYIIGNSTIHGYHGINHAGDINLLGRILQCNIPLTREEQTSYFGGKLIQYRVIGGTPMPYRFLEWIDPSIYGDVSRMELLRTFSATVVHNHIGTYLTSSVPDMIPALSSLDIPRTTETPGAVGTVFQILYDVHSVYRYTGLLLLLLFPWYGILWCMRTTQNMHNQTGMRTVIAGAAMYMACMAAFGSYDNFGRLTTPAIPLLSSIFLCGIWDGILLMKHTTHSRIMTK